ncbi:MAG: hypothetical protein OXF22_10875 [Anaerolineaceae bacterium]|nr:hypothetical protein [Chloroflexota bacterium]MCY4010236.1 hypothetical protein [Anaerolineaceae bacterium]
MGIRAEKGSRSFVEVEKPANTTKTEAIQQMTNKEFLKFIKPTYGRFMPTRRRFFRLRLPFTYDHE